MKTWFGFDLKLMRSTVIVDNYYCVFPGKTIGFQV